MHYFWIDIVLHWSCYLDYCWWIIQNSSFILHKKLSCHETTRNSILGNTKPRIDNNSKMTNYGDDCGNDDKLCCYWWLWVQTMKMTVMMMTSFVVIDDYKMMTTMTNHEDDCDPEVELFCYWLLQVDDNMANDDNDSDCWCRAIVLMMTMMTNHED